MGTTFALLLLVCILSSVIRSGAKSAHRVQREALLSNAVAARGLLPNEAPWEALPPSAAPSSNPQLISEPATSGELLKKISTQGLRCLSPERIHEIRAKHGTLKPRADMLANLAPTFDPEGFLPPELIVEEDTPAWLRQAESVLD